MYSAIRDGLVEPSINLSTRRRAILLVLALQFTLFLAAYGIRPLFGPELPWHVDHLYHLYQISLSADLWQQGSLNGYDPRFGAGYIGGAAFNWSAKGPAILVWLSNGLLPPATAYKLTIALFVVSGPALLAAAMRTVGGRPGEVLAAGIFGVVLWWASYLNWYVTAGMVSYVWSAFLAAYISAAIWRQCNRPIGLIAVVGLALECALAWWIHPHFPLLVLLFVAPLTFADYPHFKKSRLLIVAGVVSVVAILGNLPWLLAMLEGNQINGGNLLSSYRFQREVAPTRLFREAVGIFGKNASGSKIYPLLLIATFFAAKWTSGHRRRLIFACLGGWLVAQLFAYFGGLLEWIAAIEPNRIAPIGYLLLTFPAAWGCSAIWGGLHAADSKIVWHTRIAGVVLVMLLIYPVVEVFREVLPGEHGRYGFPPPQFRQPSTQVDRLIELIDHQRPYGGRVLLEQSSARVFDGAHIAGLLALRTDAEFIGGPYASDNLVNFKDGVLIGSRVDRMDDAALREILDRYAIELVIVHSPSSKKRFASLPGLVSLGTAGPGVIYRVDQPATFFFRGTGNVRVREPGRIVLDSLQGDSVIIKYHYFSSLHTLPSGLIGPSGDLAGTDTQPFIRLQNLSGRVELTSRPADK